MSDSYHLLPVPKSAWLIWLFDAFHEPTLMATLFRPPSPLNGVNPKSTYGQMDTPSLFWRIPRKLYWFTRSIPADIATVGGASCAIAGAAKAVRRPMATMNEIPKRRVRVNDICSASLGLV